MNSLQTDERVMMDAADRKRHFCYYPAAALPCWTDMIENDRDALDTIRRILSQLAESARSERHCRYCGRPAHKCGCGGAEL